jgi:MinD-like ATPase involved in chromosome partitioning or flagellar assembly
MDPRETYSRAVIHTDLENSPGWEKTGGSILLLPCKPALDDLFGKTDRNLLNAALGLLDLSDDFIILIDSGPDAINVVQAIASADIVFIPLQFSRQDVYPAVNTLRYIIAYQNSMSHPQFGGWVVIQPIQTQWEKEYMENFVNLFNTFQKNTGFICHGDNPFIHMKPSRIVHRGKHLTWSIRDEIFDPIREMAAVIDKTQTLEHTEA